MIEFFLRGERVKQVLVLGGSHSGPIVHAMRNARPDVQTLGGQTGMKDRNKARLFTIDDRGRLTLGSQFQSTLSAYLKPAGLPCDDLLALDLPFILPVTMLQPIAMVAQTETELERHLSAQVLGSIVEGLHLQVLALVRVLIDAGKTVVVVIGPGMRGNDRGQGDVFMTARRILTHLVRDTGALVADVTKVTCCDHGVLRSEYWVENLNDVIHANARWSELMAEECFRQLDVA